MEDGTPSPADQGLDSEAEETTAPPGETHDGSRAEEEESAEMAESVVLPPVVLGLTAEEDEIEEKGETEEPAVCPVEAVMDVQEKNVDCTDPAEGGDLESMDPMEIPCAEEAKDGASEDVNDDSTSGGGEMKECIGEFKEE